MSFTNLIGSLKDKGVLFDKGLNINEITNIQEYYNIVFPPDLKEFLRTELPISEGFINWRDMSEGNIERVKDRLNWPLEGMIFDIENNNFWYEAWGKKPNNLSDAVSLCTFEMGKVPKLIPICSHRYIPSEPNESGNPIFSVYQTDIIYYGENLSSYLEVEFDIKKYEDIDFNSIKEIRFWVDLQD